MAFLIRTIAVAKSGREISRDRTLETDELVVGRAPDCDIHLPDLTVELRHLKLTDTGEGVLHASSLGELPFGFDGTETDQADIDPDNGATIIVGPAKLEISRAGNDDGSEKSIAGAKAPIRDHHLAVEKSPGFKGSRCALRACRRPAQQARHGMGACRKHFDPAVECADCQSPYPLSGGK